MHNLVRRGNERNIAVLARHRILFFPCDVRNPEDLDNLPSGTEVICDSSAEPSVVAGYANLLFDITNNGLGFVHILEYVRPCRIPLMLWSSNRMYGAERLNPLPRRETPTRFEYDLDTWNHLPVD